MASSYPMQQFLASTSSCKMAPTTTYPLLQRLKRGWSMHPRFCYHIVRSKPHGLYPSQNSRSTVSCTINMTAGQSDGPGKLNLDHAMDEARKIWENFPAPVKSFPWIRALENFVQLIFDLVYAVAKYLFVPLLGISTLSEMSYCAHERKMVLIPIPLLAGIAIAGVLRDTALQLSPHLKGAEFPWHLFAIAIFFTLVKLPGPYYPYWGRILIPHFANGGLLRILWFTFLWYRSPRGEANLQKTSVDASHPEEKKL